MKEITKIIKIKRDEEGAITDIMLENGDIVPINHAILMAKDGLIDGTIVARGKNGGEFLKTDPNSLDYDNLNDLPTFKD